MGNTVTTNTDNTPSIVKDSAPPIRPPTPEKPHLTPETAQIFQGKGSSRFGDTNPFFAHPVSPPTHIIDGLIQERQIGYLAGDWALGKTPVFQQIMLAVAAGLPWLGRATSKRPVIALDAETPYEDYRPSVERLALRLGVSAQDMAHVKPILRYGSDKDKDSSDFRKVIGNPEKVCKFIRKQLEKFPRALILLDPLMEIIPYKETNSESAIQTYEKLRKIVGDFPHAAFLFTLHLRKGGSDDGNSGRSSFTNLLKNRREWLKEVAGVNKIGAHADVRLGMAATDKDEHQFVITGFRRGKDTGIMAFEKSIDQEGEYDGFVKASLPSEATRNLNSKQKESLKKLPFPFRFVEVADEVMPKASLSRLLNVARRAGVVHLKGNIWHLDNEGWLEK